MPIEDLEAITDQELFDNANADEEDSAEAPVEVAAEPAEPEAVAEPTQARDEAGRFAKQESAPEPAPFATDPPPAPPVDDNAAMVPSWRVREINEEKRALAEKVAAFEAEKLQWQRQPQQPPQPQPEIRQEKPDPLLDPDGYEKYLENKFEERILNNHREMSLANAHKTYKGEFEEAYASAQKNLDPVLKMRMQSSRDPGETLIDWHREQKTRLEVGSDLNAFRQRERDRLLADPAFLAEAVNKARGIAQPQPTPGQPRTASPVNLPPSLTRTAAVAGITADDTDLSDEGIWRHANA